MSTEPRILEGYSEWRHDDVKDPETWTEHLAPAELEELDAALLHARAKSNG